MEMTQIINDAFTIELELRAKTVAMRVVEQDFALFYAICKFKKRLFHDTYEFNCSNYMMIASSVYPQLMPHKIFVRGAASDSDSRETTIDASQLKECSCAAHYKTKLCDSELLKRYYKTVQLAFSDFDKALRSYRQLMLVQLKLADM
jgi:hypothetical protein